MRHGFLLYSPARWITMLFLMATCRLFSQQATSGGEYGAVTMKIGTIRNSSAMFVGGRGGWILDQSYGIGIGGYLLVKDLSARVSDTSGNSRLMASYGGLDIEYLVPLDSPFHFSAQALLGGGIVGHVENRYVNPRPHYDPFVVFEPGLNVEIGLTEIFRFTLGASYRFVGWLSSPVATNTDLSGPMFNISVKAGFL
jgi:hypothetical protein